MFIFSNYAQFNDLRKIRNTNVISVQDDYLNLLSGSWVYINSIDNINNSYKKWILGNSKSKPLGLPFKTFFEPSSVIMPSIDKTAPVFNLNWNLAKEEEIDNLLNKWVVSLKLKNKKGVYLFWHSSAELQSPYQYIFTQITYLKNWNIVSLEWKEETRIYEFKSKKIIQPEELDDLVWWNKKLYLITCYPFLTSLKRYVVELELKDYILK